MERCLPPHIWAIGRQLHIAPHIIQSQDAVATPVTPATCAVAWRRKLIVVGAGVDARCGRVRGAPAKDVTFRAKQHVDDITLSVPLTLGDDVEPAYVGFTATTSDVASEAHDILSFSFCENADCSPD